MTGSLVYGVNDVKGGVVKAGLTRDLVLDAALDYVDAHGLPALTMRKLGAQLGVEGMALYRHVPNKAALLDGLVDRVMTTAYAGLGEPQPGEPWVPWMREFAHGLRAALIAHPGVLPLVATRPVSSPQALAMSERWLGAMRASGMTPGMALDVVNVVAMFTIGHTLAEVGPAPEPSPALGPLDPERFPHLTAVVASGAGLDSSARFTEAVEILLAGYASRASEEHLSA